MMKKKSENKKEKKTKNSKMKVIHTVQTYEQIVCHQNHFVLNKCNSRTRICQWQAFTQFSA